MDSHMDSRMISDEKSQLPQNLEDETERLLASSRSQELTQTGYLGDARKRKSLIKGLVIRFVFLIIGVAAISGHMQNTTNRLMSPVFEYNEAYLERTLKNLGGSLFILSVPVPPRGYHRPILPPKNFAKSN